MRPKQSPDYGDSDELDPESQPNIGVEESTISLTKVHEPIAPSRNSAVDPSLIPNYWYNKKISEGGVFDDMYYVGEREHAKFDELFKASYVARVTQDRPCPKGEHGRTPGGCPCNQPKGDPGLPVAYRVFRVIRVEASAMWSEYSEKKQQIIAVRGGSSGGKFTPPVLTHATTHKHSGLFADMDDEMNEVYIFHGTFVRSALAIAQTDFKIEKAGDNRGTLFGKGCYCTESITKADEYAKDEPGGYYEGVFSVLVCRVFMGKLYVTKDDLNAHEKINSGEFDSTCGQRMFRELVVYDSRQLYPEYIVLYKRIYQKDAADYIDKLLRHRFVMEIPLHWRNNANKLEDGFQEQHKSTQAVEEFFQFFVNTSIGRASHQVVSTSRIENSALWSTYVDYKRLFEGGLGGPDGEQADPDSDLGKVEEDIRGCTKFPCKHFAKGNCKHGDKCHYSHVPGVADLGDTARAGGKRLPVDELKGQLNERFLWFAGTKQESKRLTNGKFAALTSEQQTFYESLADAVQDAGSNDGYSCAVLARVVCGKPGSNCTIEAGEQAPIIFIENAAQMYPEYVVQLYSEEDLEREKARLERRMAEDGRMSTYEEFIETFGAEEGEALWQAALSQEDAEREKAAIKIQKVWRGYITRKRLRTEMAAGDGEDEDAQP